MAEYNEKLVRFLVTLDVVGLNLFFKIKGTNLDENADRVTKRTTENRLPRALDNGASEASVTIDFKGSSISDDQPASTGAQVPHAHSRLPRVDNLVRLHYSFQRCANWYLLVKHFILFLLRYETFSRWRYLDCLLLGRLAINGRVIEVTPACVCYQATIRLLWHYVMMRPDGPANGLRMPCLEFLLDKRTNEAHWLSKATGIVEGANPSALLEFQSMFETQSGALYRPASVCNGEGKGVVPRETHKLRPNRTRKTWHVLAKCTLLFHSIFAVLFVMLALLFLRMALPVALDKRAFAYNYRHCMQWIAAERAAGRLGRVDATHEARGAGALLMVALADQLAPPGSGLGNAVDYVRPKIIRDFFIPFTDLVSLNQVTVARVLLEFAESCAAYLELALFLGAALYLVIMMSKDVIIYCSSINERLGNLIGVLRASAVSAHHKELRNSYYDSLKHSQAICGTTLGAQISPVPALGQPVLANPQEHGDQTRRTNLRTEISEIQAQVADLFNIIDAYNKFISLQSLFLLIYWLSYSALISSWIFLPGTESPKLEWYVIHCFATLYVFIMLSYMSDVKTCSRQLYRLLTVAMALDEDYRARKSIWMALLEFYKPRPLYCFTLIGSIELTYMSGFQLLIWLFSALVVASSFFHVYNIK